MVAEGYSDGEFPAWWFSPAREAEPRQDPAQRTLTEAEVAEGTLEQAQAAEDRRDTQGEEGYDPTPPRKPAPKEAVLGRPALAPASDPSAAEPPSAALSHAQPASATFSDAELSLLLELGIAEVTPGRWMHTAEQADGRIMLPPVGARQELLNIRREAQGERILARAWCMY